MSIKPIDIGSVHKITSGQVIVDLATVVKELVENSLDANANRIEVKFRNYGLDSIEVIDNGDGISSQDFESVARKHYTSKLRNFEDVEKVKTLGFRGEAMSSLCAQADVSLVTLGVGQDGPATKLVFDHSGEIISKANVPGRQGTTISISKIFEITPVRRKFLEKNYKRQFAKALVLLQEYAVISKGVTISCSHIIGTGSNTKSTVLVRSTGISVRDNIISVFGASAMNGLVPFDLKVQFSSKSVLKNKVDSNSRFTGFISEAVHGKGRNATDRQLFFINSRPCVMPRLAKAANEIYRQFNSTQFPCIICNLILDPLYFDINVSPDKRTILLHQETVLIECFKEQLLEFFGSSVITVPRKIENPLTGTQSKLSYLANRLKSKVDTKDENEGEVDESDSDNDSDSDSASESDEQSESEGEDNVEKETEKAVVENLDDPSIEADTVVFRPIQKEYTMSYQTVELLQEDELFVEQEEANQELEQESIIESPLEINQVIQGGNDDRESADISDNDNSYPGVLSTLDSSFVSSPLANSRKRSRSMSDDEPDVSDQYAVSEPKLKRGIGSLPPLSSNETPSDDDNLELEKDREVSSASRPDTPRTRSAFPSTLGKDQTLQSPVAIETSTDNILSGWSRVTHARSALKGYSAKRNNRLSISAVEIDGDLEKIESKLSMTISKDDFGSMKVVGQFNLGFIIVSKENSDGKSDLFIIDQHASDEKTNFERFQEETVLQHQPLIVARQLNLTAIEELVLIKNLSLLEKNGFSVEIDETALPGSQCKLTSLPFSKTTVFDETDLSELLHLIGESPGNQSVRCSKVRAMFAMRACRSSIMVGQSLSTAIMERVVKGLSKLDKPWSCPHGRPTLRHISSIDQWSGYYEDMI